MKEYFIFIQWMTLGDGKSHKQHCELQGTTGKHWRKIQGRLLLRVGSKSQRNRLPTVVVNCSIALSLHFEVPGIDISQFSSFHCLKGILGIQLAHGDDISIMNDAWGRDLGCWELPVGFPEHFAQRCLGCQVSRMTVRGNAGSRNPLEADVYS